MFNIVFLDIVFGLIGMFIGVNVGGCKCYIVVVIDCLC